MESCDDGGSPVADGTVSPGYEYFVDGDDGDDGDDDGNDDDDNVVSPEANRTVLVKVFMMKIIMTMFQ